MSLRRKFLILLAAGAAVVLTSCTRAEATRTPTEAARAVAVAAATRQDLGRSVELAAEFRPYQEVDLHAKVAGYLKAIYVDVGDRVRAGQPIAELEAPEMAQERTQASATLKRTQLQVERARGELARAEADLNIRRVSYDRLEGVSKARPKLVAQQEVDNMAARRSEAQAQLASARAALAASEAEVQVATASRERVETLMGYLKITAPFAGVITKRMADPGEMIQAGTASHVQAMPVVRLSQIDRLRLVLPAPESVAARLKLGTDVEIRVDSLMRVIQGRISRFTEKLDTATRTMEAEVDVANPSHEIRPGMFGYARLMLERRSDAIAIPIQALSGARGHTSVMVVGPLNRVATRAIETGVETPDLIEVARGLKEGELVVVGYRGKLPDGTPVEPRKVEQARSH
jgi:RND family efflux transporter MFP subunit